MRAIRVGVIAAFVGAALAVGAAVPAFASDAGDIYGVTNANRGGLGALRANGSLAGVAQAWANQMAANQTMSHNPNVAGQVPGGWQAVGENVATGFPSGAATVQGWMNSAPHRANILGNYTDLGVGWTVDGNGKTWAVQVFARYAAPAAAPAPAPAAPAPAPARPAPAPVAKAPVATGSAPRTTSGPAPASAPAAQAAPAAAPVQPNSSLKAADNKPHNPVKAARPLTTVSAAASIHASGRLHAKSVDSTRDIGQGDALFISSLIVLIALVGASLVSHLRRRTAKGH